MKFSVITVTFNSAATVADCVKSVTRQTYGDVEHIIIDGSSSDNTLQAIEDVPGTNRIVVSEPDKGMYDAMNKGLALATGDIVGILNSDDFYTNDDVLSTIAGAFTDPEVDVVLGDVQFVDPRNFKRIIRYYPASRFHPGSFRFGFMPPHPGFYARREFYNGLGGYRTDYRIAADYELLIRFLAIARLRYKFLSLPVVSMRPGGISTRSLRSNFILNNEILRACRENGLETNILNVYSKYLYKGFEFFGNRNK